MKTLFYNPPAWKDLSTPRCGHIGAHWEHFSGWQVHHCGHQTALYPYYAISPDGREPIVAANGRGFRSLAAAKQAIELLTAGRAVLTEDGQIID